MTHSHINAVLITALLIWAGACIGANMIAAPAKFQVADLTRPVALQVGRMQFQWVGYPSSFSVLLVSWPRGYTGRGHTNLLEST